MIHGIHIDIPSDELRAALEERAQYHDEKAAFYHKQMQVNQEIEDDDEETAHYNSARVPAAQEARLQRRHHRQRAAYLRFVAAHVIPETYRLDENDLRRLELLDQ